MRFFFFVAAIFTFPLLSWGQVDVSTELLLRPAAVGSPKEAGLESGRYKVRKAKTLPGKKVSGTEVDSSANMEKTTTVVLPATTTSTTTSTTSTTHSVTTTTQKATKAKNSEMEKILFSPAPEKSPEKPVEKPVETVETKIEKIEMEEPTVTEQVRDIVLGNGQATVEAYKEQIHPDDIRLNRLEVSILPGVVSNSSKSSYSFRNYNTFSPEVQAGANLWMTPFLGVYGNYTTSMGADVVEDASTQSRSSVQHEWTEIGLDIRKFFGMSRKSNSLQFGIHLSEYKFLIPGDSVNHMKLRSSGVGIHMLSRIPVAPSYSWIFGGKLIPRVQHSETSSNNLSSGSNGDSTRVDLIVGGEFKMARQNQIVWDLTTSFEKNQFSGQAQTVDPETGFKPKGVSVENTFVIFSLGYRWGQ